MHRPAFGRLFAQSTSGEFKIGSTVVPLSKTITLQGGLTEEVAGFSEVLPAANGETLSRTPQTVPGGLFKIVAPKFLPGFLQELFNNFINKGITRSPRRRNWWAKRGSAPEALCSVRAPRLNCRRACISKTHSLAVAAMSGRALNR